MSDRAQDADDAPFVPAGSRLVSAERESGSWSPDSLHCGNLTAAVIRETER